MSLTFSAFVNWWDFVIGVQWSRATRTLSIYPLPMLGVSVRFGE